MKLLEGGRKPWFHPKELWSSPTTRRKVVRADCINSARIYCRLQKVCKDHVCLAPLVKGVTVNAVKMDAQDAYERTWERRDSLTYSDVYYARDTNERIVTLYLPPLDPSEVQKPTVR